MPRIETNDFAITNLESLSSRYRLYRIKGLNRDHSEYYLNRQHIIRKLGFSLRKPVTIIERGGAPYLIVRNDAEEIASPMSLVRVPDFFEAIGDSFEVDYTVRSPENDEICVRFLQLCYRSRFTLIPICGNQKPVPHSSRNRLSIQRTLLLTTSVLRYV